MSITLIYFQIGMLSLGYPKINLQFANVSGYDQLLEMVRDKLETTPVRQLGHSSSVPQGIEEDDHKQQAFQVCESVEIISLSCNSSYHSSI